MRLEEKHIDFDLGTGEDQDLNFDVTTGRAQDEARLLSKNCTGTPSQKRREEPFRSEETSQESESSAADAREINSSRADFSHTDLFYRSS